MNKAAAARSYPTRERILEAAIQRFARKSYEETGLRDIAADAEVDVAYVHRSFGSKEQLFAEAVRASTGVARILAEAPEDLCRHLAKQAFDRDREASTAQIGPLDIIIHSLSSPAAARLTDSSVVPPPLMTNTTSLRSAIRRATSTSSSTGWDKPMLPAYVTTVRSPRPNSLR